MTNDNNRLAWKDGHPYSTAFDDIYYPPQDGVGAAYHVFIQAQGIEGRMATQSHLAIGELGFGTGLNFLTLLSCWKALNKPCDLTFVSCEKYPLSPADLRQALAAFPSLAEEAEALYTVYPYRTPGFHSLRLYDGRVHLLLLFGDAAEMLGDLDGTLDAWFLDGFNPKHNPELWTPELFHCLHDHSHDETTLATWSVSGMVRRNLEQADISWEKIPGFGKKKQALRGRFPGAAARRQDISLQDKHLGVIGAGIAGSALVHALKGHGCKVSVYDTKEAIAAGASGNRYALLVPYYTKAPTPLRELYGNGYQRALQEVAHLQQQQLLTEAFQPGAIHIPVTKRLQQLHEYLQQQPGDPRFMQAISASEASTLAGIPLSESAFYYPDAMYLNPQSLCRTLIERHEECALYLSSTIDAIASDSSRIRVLPSSGTEVEPFDKLFLCTAWNTNRFQIAENIQTNRVRGQLLSRVAATDRSNGLRTLLCYDGYCTPAHENMHCIGVSYSRTQDATFSLEEQTMILDRLHKHAPSCGLSSVQDTRVSFRATTYDRMPIAGPLPDSDSINALLQKDGISNSVYQAVDNQIHVLTGLGSRGFISAILLAEALVSQTLSRPVGIPRSILKAVHPARLPIRDWKQKR